MKKLQCELCGSVDIIKTSDDVFQCQYCGCKYTAEQAKLLIQGEVVLRKPDFEIVGGKLVRYQGSETDVVIPNDVTVIGEGAFADCSGMISVSIPEGVKSIEKNAFSGCELLTELILPDSATRLGERAFQNCTGLKSVTLSRNTLTIGAYAFQGCSSLTKIDIPDSVNELGKGAFQNCTELKSINLSKNITKFSADVFEGCTSLVKLVIPEGVVAMEGSSFPPMLETIVLPSSLKEIRWNSPRDLTHCTRLSVIEGNSDVFFDSFDFIPFRSMLASKLLQSIPVLKEYTSLRLRRRVDQRCEYCGGEFKGIFNAVCTKCGRPKSY